MKYGFSLIVRGEDATPETFVRIAERSEALDMDSLWLSAHVVLPPQVKSGYVLIPGRMHPPHWRECYWEPFTVLSFLAAHTKRITLGTSVVCSRCTTPSNAPSRWRRWTGCPTAGSSSGSGSAGSRRNSKCSAGISGTGGYAPTDAIELMKTLWAEDPVTYKGRFYSCEDASFSPKPVQRPHPPIWVAGAGRPACRRAARYGEAFHPARMPVEKLVEMRRILDDECGKIGRAPGSVELCVKLPLVFQDDPGEFLTQGTPGRIADGIKRYIEVGAEHFTFDFVPEKVDVALDVMERFAQEVRPRLD